MHAHRHCPRTQAFRGATADAGWLSWAILRVCRRLPSLRRSLLTKSVPVPDLIDVRRHHQFSCLPTNKSLAPRRASTLIPILCCYSVPSLAHLFSRLFHSLLLFLVYAFAISLIAGPNTIPCTQPPSSNSSRFRLSSATFDAPHIFYDCHTLSLNLQEREAQP
jgi:hypothetical protein